MNDMIFIDLSKILIKNELLIWMYYSVLWLFWSKIVWNIEDGSCRIGNDFVVMYIKLENK